MFTVVYLGQSFKGNKSLSHNVVSFSLSLIFVSSIHLSYLYSFDWCPSFSVCLGPLSSYFLSRTWLIEFHCLLVTLVFFLWFPSTGLWCSATEIVANIQNQTRMGVCDCLKEILVFCMETETVCCLSIRDYTIAGHIISAQLFWAGKSKETENKCKKE